MNKTKKNLFSATQAVAKKGTVAMLCMILFGLIFISGCKKDETDCGEKEPEYPIEIPFTEYFPSCLNPRYCWVNLNYDEKIVLINSMEQLRNYLTFNNNTNPVDFSKHSLLLVSGYKESGVSYITKELRRISENDEYDLDIEIFLNAEKIYNNEWTFALIIEKLNEKGTFTLKTKTTYGETDFIYRGNGEKDYFTFRKDKVIIQCNSKDEAEKLFNRGFFYWQDPSNYENVLATIINPLKITILDILQLPEVVDAAYGLEYHDYTLYYPNKSVYVEFKDGLTPEEVFDAIGLSEKVEEITLVSYPGGYWIELDVPFRDIFRVCRKLYESGLCKFAEPLFIRQMIIV